MHQQQNYTSEAAHWTHSHISSRIIHLRLHTEHIHASAAELYIW